MKKLLVVLLILAMAFGAFAQVNIGGSIRANGVYNTSSAKGFYDLGEGFSINNNGSRINMDASWEGKAGFSADLRVNTTNVKANSFWAWARPADWFKVNLGWMDIGDYLIKDGTETVNFGGNFRNSSKLDPLGGEVKFGALAQFLLMDNNLNIGAAFMGSDELTDFNSDESQAYIAAMFKIPDIGRAAIEAQFRTTPDNTADYMRLSATFQYQAKMFDVGVGIKYIGKGGTAPEDIINPYKDTGVGVVRLDPKSEFGIMLLAGIRPIEKLNIALGAQLYLMNAFTIAETVSVSYDFGFIKPVFYAYGFTSLDTTKVAFAGNFNKGGSTSKVQSAQLFGVEFNIPVKVGKSSFLAAGVAYDTGAEAFQIPVYFRLFF